MKPIHTFKHDIYNYVIHRDALGFYFNRSSDAIDDLAKVYGVENLKYYIRFRFDFYGMRDFPGYKEDTCSSGVYYRHSELASVIDIDHIDDCELGADKIELVITIGSAAAPEKVELSIPLDGRRYMLYKNLILIIN